MIYGQEYVRILVWFVLSLGCILGVFQGLMGIAQLDKVALEERKYREVSRKSVGVWCFVGAMWVCRITWGADKAWEGMRHEAASVILVILLSTIVACLLAASVMDEETYLIYNYVWWLGTVAGVLLMLLCDSGMWFPVLLFAILQECFFAKMYGRADCHGFVVCSLAEAAFGMGMREYLLHMLIAFGMLGVMQLLKRNVGKGGNLKTPIPFLPYISIAFGGNLIAYLCV